MHIAKERKRLGHETLKNIMLKSINSKLRQSSTVLQGER